MQPNLKPYSLENVNPDERCHHNLLIPLCVHLANTRHTTLRPLCPSYYVRVCRYHHVSLYVHNVHSSRPGGNFSIKQSRKMDLPEFGAPMSTKKEKKQKVEVKDIKEVKEEKEEATEMEDPELVIQRV
eukprot:Platyproteum_vivax@DN5267_c0_g1_i2.p1